MTISATYTPAQASGNGVTVAFPFTFKTFDQADLVVIITDTDDVDTTQTITTHYTVALNADQNNNPGGTVTMVTAPTSGETLTIARVIDALQETDIANGGGFYPEVLEDALDRLTMLSQQNKDAIDRSFTLPVTVAGVSTELPVPEANNIVGWNATADALQNFAPSVFATVVAFGTAKADIFDGDGATLNFTLTANPGAQNNLDVSISGVTQTPGIDYTWSAGTTISFVVAPPVGTDNVLVRYMQGLANTNAQDATYTPSGTGYVETTIKAKLRETFSIADFGAAGDGVTDDTAINTAARAAIVAAGGGRLHYPPAAGYLIDGNVRQPGDLIIDADFPAYSGDEPAGPFRVYAAAEEGVGKIAGSFIITNGAAIPFTTLGTGDTCAVSGWGYRDTGGTNPMVVANFGARIENNLGAITWGLEVDINNEGATQDINDPAGGEAIVINTGSTYSPSTGIRIRRATGEGTGPGYLRGIMIDGVREQAITCVAMEAASFSGMSPAAPGTLTILTSYKSADTDVRFTISESGEMAWGSGSAAQDTALARATAGGLILTGPFETDTAFYVGSNQVVGARNVGWAAMTGAADESTVYAVASVTLPQLAGRVMALQAALTTHGLIGA